LAQIEKYLHGEVKTYNQYLTSDVYGYSIDVDGEHKDSCWGFFGVEEVKKEAILAAEHIFKKELEDSLEPQYA